MRKADFKLEDNPEVAKKVWRHKELGCAYCPPNKQENAGRRAKHGSRKPKAKDQKRGRA